jgi:ribokinase
VRPDVEVLVLGSCIADIAVSVPSLPVDGQTVMATDIRSRLGGKGANQAVGCARLGLDVAIITALGRDESGDQFLRLFSNEGVRTQGVSHCDTSTGIGIPLLTPAGGKAIIVMPGAAMALTREAVCVALGAYSGAAVGLAQLEISLEALEAFLDGMCARKGMVVLNTAPCLAEREHLFGLAQILVTNRSEAEWLTGSSVTSKADAARAATEVRARYGVRAVVVTLGAEGSVVVDQHGKAHIPVPATTVVDRTGAGDAFCAALTVGLVRGLPFRKAARLASKYASLSCEGVGAIDGLPRAAGLPAAR